MRTVYVEVMKRMVICFALDPIDVVNWFRDDSALKANGHDAINGNYLEVFVPTDTLFSIEVKTYD